MALRVGLAGCGVHGERYARHLLSGDVPGARLAAISRRDATLGRRFADEHTIAFVADPHELATHPGIDAVILVLPPDLHGPVATTCVRAGRALLVEKPLTANLTEAETLCREVHRTGSLLMVAHTLRFDPLVRTLKDQTDGLGRLRIVSINQRFEPSDRTWLDRPEGGGLFLNTGVHGFDLLRYFTGLEPRSIVAISGRAKTVRTEDQFAAVVDFGDGQTLGVVDNARSTASRSGRIELIGESGQAWGDHIHRTFQTVSGRVAEPPTTIDAKPTIPLTLRAFVDCVENRTVPPVTVDDGCAAVRMVEAARLSAASGRKVALNELGEPGD